MATADEYAAWIVQNADKKGTPQFEVVARAYQDARSKPRVISGGARAPDALDNPNMAVEGNSFGRNLLEGLGSGFNSVKQALTFAPKSEVQETQKLNAPLMTTAGGTIGNIAGNVAAAAPTAFIPGANTVVGATLIGFGTGGLLTPGDLSDRWTGAKLGALGGFAGQMIPRAFSSVKAAAEPFSESGRNAIIGRVMNRAAGDNAPDVARRLSLAKALVPGSQPTAAEVGESGGIAALQRAMSAADPEAYAHRGMEQASARVNALRSIAGDDAARAAAVSARESATKPLYDAAKSSVVRGDPALDELLRRPSIQKAMARAQELAADEGKKITFGSNKPAQEVATGLLDAGGNAITKTVPEQFKEYSGEGLHYLKLALDDLMDSPERFGIGKNEMAAIAGNKRQLLGWLESKIPEYGKARTQFAALSKPINQMDVGKALLEKMQGPLSDHGALANETGATFARALRNEGETVARNATGFRQGIDQVLDPQQMASVNAVAQDLARKANAQNLGRGVGSNTFQNFAMDNLAQQGGMPSAVRSTLGAIPGLSPTMTLVAKGGGALGNLAYKNADEVMRKSMAQALLNPQQAASLMEAAGKPALMARALAKLPQSVQSKIPPEDILKLLQAAPGVAGAAGTSAYLQQ